MNETYTDRDILRDEIERMCCISGNVFEERDSTITVVGVMKYMFTPQGELKAVIRDGVSYTDKEVRRVR
jgi:hypothetical protein